VIVAIVTGWGLSASIACRPGALRLQPIEERERVSVASSDPRVREFWVFVEDLRQCLEIASLDRLFRGSHIRLAGGNRRHAYDPA